MDERNDLHPNSSGAAQLLSPSLKKEPTTPALDQAPTTSLNPALTLVLSEVSEHSPKKAEKVVKGAPRRSAMLNS
jgi:hypothetical protein